MNEISPDLDQAISRAVQEIMKTSHAALSKALSEAFGCPRQDLSTRKAGSASNKHKSRPRRTAADIAALSIRLEKAINDTPGQVMVDLATELESTPRDLQIPAAHLKSANRVKSVGQRGFTRYFPLTAPSE